MNKFDEGTRELRLVFLYLLAFFTFNVLTATSYPFPHADECIAAEPAISMLHGQGFSDRTYEMVNTYAFLLVPWVKIFGASLRSIRSADIASMTAALFVLWFAVKRLGIVTSASWRLLLLALVSTDYAVIFSYRSGRYDGFGVLLMAAALWLMSIHEKRARVLSLFLLCLLVPWAGPQYMPLLFTAGAVLFLLFRWRYWMEIASSFLASAIGGAIFLETLSATGRLKRFLWILRPQGRGVARARALISHGQFNFRSLIPNHNNYIPKDLSLPFLFAAAIVLFIYLRRQGEAVRCKALSYGVLFAILLTCILLLVAKFPTYYSYMIVVPLAVSVCAGLSICRDGKVRFAAMLLCALSAFAGVGVQTVAYALDRQDHDYARIESFVEQSVHPDDTVLADPQAYLAVRQRARDAYVPIPDWPVTAVMSKEQKNSVNVLITHPEWAADLENGLGGNWHDTGQELVPVKKSIFTNTNLGFVNWTLNDLRVYRRQ